MCLRSVGRTHSSCRLRIHFSVHFSYNEMYETRERSLIFRVGFHFSVHFLSSGSFWCWGNCRSPDKFLWWQSGFFEWQPIFNVDFRFLSIVVEKRILSPDEMGDMGERPCVDVCGCARVGEASSDYTFKRGVACAFRVFCGVLPNPLYLCVCPQCAMCGYVGFNVGMGVFIQREDFFVFF